MRRFGGIEAVVCLGLVACAEPAPEPPATLEPGPNPIESSDPLWSPQPHRDRPRAICVSSDEKKAWVMLAGIEDDPGEEIAVVDLSSESVVRRVRLAASPWGCALDPTGRFLAVTLRTSDRAVILDAATDEPIVWIRVPFYTESVIWSRAGDRLYFGNRWKDSIIHVDVDPSRISAARGVEGSFEDPIGIPAGDNPGPLALSEDGRFLFVGLVAGAALSVVDTLLLSEVDVDGDPRTTSIGAPEGISRIELHSPVGGLAVRGDHLYLTDIGGGLGSHPFEGRDIERNGEPGDGTANVIFQDLQNEIAVIDVRTLRERHRYTSDSICCSDFRDVDPDRPERGLELPAPDTWKPDVVPHLPPKSAWIVAGALPEALAIRGDVLWVAYPGSNEVQSFQILDDGGLRPLQGAGGLYKTGLNPKAIAATALSIITVDRLGESLTLIPASAAGPGEERTLIVGDVAGGPFPATDAEIGEGINEMTAAFTIDGDQTCVHCHRDNGAVSRPVVMPLQEIRAFGARNVMAQRGLFDTRPWFFESAMDETNFFPVLNEFARRENYCCERLDPTVWSRYPALEQCRSDPGRAGCNHVLRCEEDPPPECAARPYAKMPFLRRSSFIKDGARKLFGRDTTIGDVLSKPAPDGGSEPIALDFEGITRALGLFMLRTPRLLPNPNLALDTAPARRGSVIFQQPATGCVFCHPLPISTTASRPAPFSPFGMPIRFPPVISPSRAPNGADASRVTLGFIGTFPETIQTPAGVHFGATPLRGIWDRPSTSFFHDGRATSLTEALATPGHPALGPREKGRNERDGTLDTHGGTSHLSRWELHDLIQFVLTL